jgi:16S rRNA (uracil1498-N3)-methyltransferase
MNFSEKTIVILIGPEGDFSSNEIEVARENGYKAVSLGSTRLRTETAGLYAVTVLKTMLS